MDDKSGILDIIQHKLIFDELDEDETSNNTTTTNKTDENDNKNNIACVSKLFPRRF
jgi:hypothetical protein